MKKRWNQLTDRQKLLAIRLADQARELGLELTVSQAGGDLSAAISQVAAAQQRLRGERPVTCPACGQDLPIGRAAVVVYEPPPS